MELRVVAIIFELICRCIKAIVKVQTGSAAGLIHIEMGFVQERKEGMILTQFALAWE